MFFGVIMMEIFGINPVDYAKPAFFFVFLTVAGWIVGAISGWAVKHLLRKKPLKLDERLKEWKVDDAISNLSISKILGTLTFWFVFSVFLGEASNKIDLGVVSNFIELVVLYIPRVIISVIVVLVTLIAADFVSDKIRVTKSKIVDIVGIAVKPVIIIFGLIIAGDQLGIKLDFGIAIIQDIVRALVWGIALAFGLAFGLGYGLDRADRRSVLPQKIEECWKKIK